MSKFVTPHSDKWFEELAKYNPPQVEITQFMIYLAGSSDVCSICGDKPAGDFHVVNSLMSRKEFATIRLCEDCLGFRKRKYNEKFEKINE